MKRWLVPLIAIVILSLSVQHSPAQAQGSTTISDDLTAGLGAQSHEASGGYPYVGGGFFSDTTHGGHWAGGYGRTSGGAILSEDIGGGRKAGVVVDLGSEQTVIALSWYMHAASDNWASWNNRYTFWDGAGDPISYVDDHSTGSEIYPFSSWVQKNITSISVAGVRYISMVSENAGGDGSGYPIIDDISVTYESGSGPDTSGFTMRPLALADEDPTFALSDKPDSIDTLFDSAYVITNPGGGEAGGPENLQAISSAPGAYVHSIAPGVVTAIHPLSALADCGLYDPDTSDRIDGQGVISPECWVLLNTDTQLLAQTFSTGYIVQVEQDDPTSGDRWVFSYVLDQPDPYISVGDNVEAGCVLGVTIAMGVPNPNNIVELSGYVLTQAPPDAQPSGFSPGDLANAILTSSGKGFASVYAFDVNTDIAGRLAPTEYPSNDTPCKSVDDTYSDCLLSNPTFSNAGEGWQTSGEVVFPNTGAIMGMQSKIWRDMLLDSSTDYTLTVGFDDPTTTPGGLFVSIGQEPHGASVPVGSISGTLELPTDTLSSTQVYHVGFLTGGEQEDFTSVRYICLTAGSPNVAPGACYFNNPYFDYGLSGWDTSEDAHAQDVPNGGAIQIQSGGVFEQNVHLFPDESGPHTYTLTVKIYSFSTTGYTPPPDPTQIRFLYDWGGDSAVPIGIIDLTGDTTTNTVSTNIIVSDETNATFSITAQFLDADDTILTDSHLLITIDSACLSSDNFPGQGGGGTGPPFAESCSVVVQPTDELLSSWTLYHWHNLNRFFQCDLMKLLNQMYMLFIGFFRTVSYAIRYWIAAFQEGVHWLGSQLLPWLASHLSNIATPRIVVAEGGGGDSNCHDLFCLLVSLLDNIRRVFDSISELASNIITSLAQLGSDLVNGITHIAVDLIAFFSHVIDVVAGLLGLIINGAISIILVVITRLFDLLQQGLALLQALLTGYQTATPSAPFGLPNCDQIDPLTNGTCGVFWLLNNTLFAPGAIGAELITLFIAVASIMLIIWIIEEVLTMIVTINEVS